MPNLFFMGVQFFYLMALVLWVGGIVSIGFLVAPTIFAQLESRTQAGALVGKILQKFDTVVFVCISILAVTSLIKYLHWETPTPWIVMRYVFLCVMALSTLYSSFLVTPKMEALKKEIVTFENLPAQDPRRVSFNRYHKISKGIMVVSLLCGLGAILLS